jgi:HSP20 family protein
MLLVPVSRAAARVSQLDRAFDQTINHLLGVTSRADDTSRSPALDVTESDQAYTLQMDLPGVRKEDIKITVEGRRVRLEAPLPTAEALPEGSRVVYRERAVSAFARSLVLPVEIDQTVSQAKLEAGVLTLTLGKRQAVAASQLTVS